MEPLKRLLKELFSQLQDLDRESENIGAILDLDLEKTEHHRWIRRLIFIEGKAAATCEQIQTVKVMLLKHVPRVRPTYQTSKGEKAWSWLKNINLG